MKERSMFIFQGILMYSREIHIYYIYQLYPCKKSYVYIFNTLEVFHFLKWKTDGVLKYNLHLWKLIKKLAHLYLFKKFFKVGLLKKFCKLNVDKKYLSRSGLLEMMKRPWCGHLWKTSNLNRLTIKIIQAINSGGTTNRSRSESLKSIFSVKKTYYLLPP